MLRTMFAALAAVSLMGLGACGQTTVVEDESAVENAAEEAANDIENAADKAGNEIEQAGENAEEAVEDATDGNPNTNP